MSHRLQILLFSFSIPSSISKKKKDTIPTPTTQPQFSQPPYRNQHHNSPIEIPHLHQFRRSFIATTNPKLLLLAFFFSDNNMKSEKTSTGSKFTRCLKAPLRVLCRARDLYVKSMTGCAGRVNYGYAGSTLPKSFSVNSSRMSEDEDIQALCRAMSQRSQMEAAAAAATAESLRAKGLPKSYSMGIGRIDEDKPCYFSDELKVKSDVSMYPRSKSYAVTKRTGILA